MKLKAHQRYLIQYRLSNQRKDRVFVGTYLGDISGSTDHQFDLRPSAGTATIPDEAIRLAQTVSKRVPHMQPKEAERWLKRNLEEHRIP